MATMTLFSDEELSKLRLAMDWVIPPEEDSPGAGTKVTLGHLLDLLHELGNETIERYRTFLPTLTLEDLGDPSNRFAQSFIDHVRDVYYGYPDTGAWVDLGFGRHSNP